MISDERVLDFWRQDSLDPAYVFSVYLEILIKVRIQFYSLWSQGPIEDGILRDIESSIRLCGYLSSQGDSSLKTDNNITPLMLE